jgi:hypothetical protein
MRRARRTKATRVSLDQRRATLPDVADVDFERPDDFAAVTYDRVLIL